MELWSSPLDSAFYAQEVVGVALGDKPLAQADLEPSQLSDARRLAETAGLAVELLDDDAAGPLRRVLLAKDRPALDRLAREWKGADVETCGRLLGYPDCCVAAYAEWAKDPEAEEDVVRGVADRSPKGPWSFLLNSAFVYHSRLFKRPGRDAERLNRVLAAAGGPHLRLKAVITWHPCSFACPESLARARRIWEVLAKTSPEDAAWLRRSLAVKLSFKDWCEIETLPPGARKAGPGGLLLDFTAAGREDAVL